MNKKLTFALTEGQIGPFPVSTESIWCEIDGDLYRVKSIPFFVDGLSFDDLIAVRPVGNDAVVLESVARPSGNSTLWVYFKDATLAEDLVKQLVQLGCGAESGVIQGYFSVNVPFGVDIRNVYSILQKPIADGLLLVDYPSLQH